MATSNLNKKRLLKMLVITLMILSLGLILGILAMNGFTIPCIFRRLTGLLCPGCGNTRAVISLLKFDFIKALKFNPLFPIQFGYIGFIYIVSSINYIKGGKFKYSGTPIVIDIIVASIIIIGAIIRNII